MNSYLLCSAKVYKVYKWHEAEDISCWKYWECYVHIKTMYSTCRLEIYSSNCEMVHLYQSFLKIHSPGVENRLSNQGALSDTAELS